MPTQYPYQSPTNNGQIVYGTVLMVLDGNGFSQAISATNPLLITPAGVTTATLTNVAASASNIQLLAANTTRKRIVIVNDSTAILYINFGATASNTAYTYYLNPGDTYESPTHIYTGQINGIWSAANGAARITEMA